MAAKQDQARRQGLGDREGNPATPPQGMALACPGATWKARVLRAFWTLVFKVLVPARLEGRARG